MVSYHPASKGKSSIYGVILVLLVFLTVIFSGCSALPTSGSDHIIVPDSKTSLAVARESLDVPKTTALDRRFDSNLVPTGSQPLSLLILRSWEMFISPMFFDADRLNELLNRYKKVRADPQGNKRQRDDRRQLSDVHRHIGQAWTRTVQQDCDISSVARAIGDLKQGDRISTVMRAHGGSNVCIHWTQNIPYRATRLRSGRGMPNYPWIQRYVSKAFSSGAF